MIFYVLFSIPFFYDFPSKYLIFIIKDFISIVYDYLNNDYISYMYTIYDIDYFNENFKLFFDSYLNFYNNNFAYYYYKINKFYISNLETSSFGYKEINYDVLSDTYNYIYSNKLKIGDFSIPLALDMLFTKNDFGS
jgi:hypothetical protein